MSVSDAYIIGMRQYLLRKFSRRNELYRQLRQFYDSDYFVNSEAQGIKLVYNKLGLAVDRYTDFMVQPPDWQVLPMDTTLEARKQADAQEKFLYSQYRKNHIEIIQGWLANLQSKLGMFAIEIRPNFGNAEKVVTIDVPIPEYVLPYPKSDNVMDNEAILVLGNQYDNQTELFQPNIRPGDALLQTNLTKYYDKDCIIVLKDGNRIAEVEHQFGFIPLIIGQNKVKPHFVEGLGDMDQGAGLQMYFNDLLSYEADILEYAANPITIIKGYSGDNLPTGPRAQWHLGRDMDASFLTWPGQPPAMEQMFNRIEHSIDDMTLTGGDALYGHNIPSGTSGTAVQSLLSGIQAVFLRKQVHLGAAYVKVNEIIFRMTEKYFPDTEILVRGKKKNNVFVVKFKGSDIKGNYETQAIFPPGVLDQPARVNLEIQKMTAGLQSKYTSMENAGIQSPMDEMELIRQEKEAEIEREIAAQGGGMGGGNSAGVSPDQANQYQAVANKLSGSSAGFGAGAEQSLVSVISKIPKIKGEVLFGGQQGVKFTIVLEDMNDKATIANRLPPNLKGKIIFRKFVSGQDDHLMPISQPQGQPVPAGAPAPNGQPGL